MYRKKSGRPGKRVLIMELDLMFESIAECARYLECDESSVRKVANKGGRHHSIQGYTVRFCDRFRNVL